MLINVHDHEAHNVEVYSAQNRRTVTHLKELGNKTYDTFCFHFLRSYAASTYLTFYDQVSQLGNSLGVYEIKLRAIATHIVVYHLMKTTRP